MRKGIDIVLISMSRLRLLPASVCLPYLVKAPLVGRLIHIRLHQIVATALKHLLASGPLARNSRSQLTHPLDNLVAKTGTSQGGRPIRKVETTANRTNCPKLVWCPPIALRSLCLNFLKTCIHHSKLSFYKKCLNNFKIYNLFFM